MNTSINKGNNMTEKKELEDLTPTEMKDLKVEFAPGCFDDFEGTQEELEELVAEIQRMFTSGEAQTKARRIDFDNPTEDDIDAIEHLMEIEERANQGRKLQ